MLTYIKKFVLDIMPSVVATIIGAYIVHFYVIPAATHGRTAAAVSAQPAPDATLNADKPSFVKGVAEKAAIEKTAEKSGESAPADSKRRHTTSRAGKAAEQTASASETSSAEERRDANDLARAAIERLRSSPELPRAVASAPAQPAMPALPPAVVLATPSPDIFNAGTGAIVAPAARAPQMPARNADASRPMPPGVIPAPPPLELHDDIVTTATGRAATVAEDMISTAKSVFHAVLPR